MIKTAICKGDKVVIHRGEGKKFQDEKGQPVVCTVLQVDRVKGFCLLDMPRQRGKRGEKETPRRGVESWKTVRYNPKSGEAGGLKILKRPIPFSNLRIVEKAPRRELAGRPE